MTLNCPKCRFRFSNVNWTHNCPICGYTYDKHDEGIQCKSKNKNSIIGNENINFGVGDNNGDLNEIIKRLEFLDDSVAFGFGELLGVNKNMPNRQDIPGTRDGDIDHIKHMLKQIINMLGDIKNLTQKS